MLIIWIVTFSVLGNIGAIITVALFLLLKGKIQKMLIPCLISYATGTLLTTAFIVLLPRAMQYSSPMVI